MRFVCDSPVSDVRDPRHLSNVYGPIGAGHAHWSTARHALTITFGFVTGLGGWGAVPRPNELIQSLILLIFEPSKERSPSRPFSWKMKPRIGLPSVALSY